MANKTIDAVLKEMQAHQSELLKKSTMEWYLQRIRQLVAEGQGEQQAQPDESKEADYKKSLTGQQSSLSSDLLGRMIMFRYEPKTKDKLPYYDRFPLVIPLTPDAGGSDNTGETILGLNLHYLPPKERAQLLTALTTLINNTKKLDEKSRIVVQYKFLKGASRFRLFRPCLKRYLNTHIKSRIFIINPTEWHHVMMLPVARWEKASEYQVWGDSMKMIRKKN
jgi:hypothetical protein